MASGFGCLTLTRFLLAEQRKIPNATGDFTQLLNAILTAVKCISSAARRTGFAKTSASTGDQLAVFANESLIDALRSSHTTCLLVSKKRDKPLVVDVGEQGRYVVCFNPLDGSSDVDSLFSLGTIFSIFRKGSDKPADEADALQSGRNCIAAGYALYGSATLVVLSIGAGTGVHSFMLDPAIGDFLLVERNIKVPARGTTYSINEGLSKFWSEPVEKYVESLKKQEDSKTYEARYSGSLVTDLHRTLKNGGVLMYPDVDQRTLRLLSECIPMAFIIQEASGLATTGTADLLTTAPKRIDQLSPIFLGSKNDIEDLKKCFLKQNPAK